MGNKATTIRTPPAEQSASNSHSDIHTQIGEHNYYNQNNEIIQGVSHIDWYIFIFVVGFVIILCVVLLRYLNVCLNKRISRRAQSEVFKQQA